MGGGGEASFVMEAARQQLVLVQKAVKSCQKLRIQVSRKYLDCLQHSTAQNGCRLSVGIQFMLMEFDLTIRLIAHVMPAELEEQVRRIEGANYFCKS